MATSQELGEVRKTPEFLYLSPQTMKLSEFGIDFGVDKLNFGNDPSTYFKGLDSVNGNHRYFLFPHRLFAGEPLAQFFSSIAPYKLGSKEGMQWDVTLPATARRRLARGVKETTERFDTLRLHRIHSDDPEIGEEYQKLQESGEYKRIQKALSQESGDSVYVALSNLAFIKSKEDCINKFNEEADKGLEDGDATTARIVAISVDNLREEGAHLFREFFEKTSDFKPEPILWHMRQFDALPVTKRCELLQEFLNLLTPEQRNTSALFQTPFKIDLETKDIPDKYYTNTHMQFVGDSQFEISNDKGVRVLVEPSKYKGFGRYDWKMISSHQPPDYHTNGYAPVLCWEKDSEGKRRFLEHEEMREALLKNFKLSRWGNRKLGQVWGVYLSPNITANWDKTMTLVHGYRSQEMMAAQMLIWPVIDSEEHPHARQLLNGDGSAIPKLERVIDEKMTF